MITRWRLGGFTIVELMITILVLAVLISLGAPNLQQLIINNRLTTEVNSLVAGLQYARSEALRRNEVVTIGAASTDWSNGWSVWLDTDADNAVDGTETLLRAQSAQASGYTIKPPSSVTTSPAALRFNPNGTVANASPLITEVCKSGVVGRVVTVSLVGQVQTSNIKDSSNNDVKCP
ncbi:MAG: GspH/FimT family pseudopilin [Gammaproteobacteria bacterium]|nr:GspH/FimT family pseudopilin [Gammaproteobacteria bacterium]